MEKYKSLIVGGLLTVAAIAVIVWILRESDDTLNAATANAPTSPDEDAQTLNGLAPLNAQVDVAQPHLTYNVPQPGNVAPISSDQQYLTSEQLHASGVATADWTIDNLLQVNLPPSDFVN